MSLKPNLHRFFKYTCNDKYSKKDIIDIFIPYVDTTPGFGKDGDCWEWRGTVGGSGYGIVVINGSRIRAHRAAYEIATNKLIPNGKCVLHKCDNRKCVKAYLHLSLGTHQDNMKDMVNKGRQAMGENHYSAKLTWVQVNNIRKDWNTGEYTQQQLADKFNISPSVINLILNNKKWHDGEYVPIKFKNKGNSKLNQEQADDIRIKYSTGKYTMKQLGDSLGVTKTSIGYIIQNKAWIKNK